MVVSKSISSSFCLILQLLLVLKSCSCLETREYQDSCRTDIYRSRLRFCPKGRERMAMGKIFTTSSKEPMTLNQDLDKDTKPSIKGFNYEFQEVDGQHELRDKHGNNFKFDVNKGDRTLNQRRYEDLGEAITDYVYEYLEEKLKLKKVTIPVGAGPKDPKGFFFMSDDALKSEKLMILIHGSGVVRAGQWARSLIINHSFESGTMVPYIEQAKKEGFGVLITNGNHNYDEKVHKRIKGSENPQGHFVYVWNHFIKNAKAKHIVIVAHSFGGVVVLHGVRNIPEAMERIKALAFTDSVHSVGGRKESKNIKKWFKKKARNWVTSQNPLDAPVKINCKDDCDQVSAATMDRTMTSHFAKDSIFKFFEEKLNATMDHTMTSHFAKDSIFNFFEENLNENDSSFIKPTRISLISPQDQPFEQDSVYKMTSSPRGIAVIVNVKNFTTEAEDSHRSGSEFDVQGLVKLFEGLDFEIEMLIDNTKAVLLSEFGKISEYDFSAYDCFVVCIMSHGGGNYFLACDGKKIKIQSISEMFNNKNCETLCEKPKLFFINTCRGNSVDDGIVVKESCPVSKEPQSSPKPKADTTVKGRQTTAENADMLTAFSSVEGYFSYRHTKRGSWFISSLIEVFREHAGKEDVLSMLTKVNKKVNSEGGLGEKQVPKPETTLTKKVFFWPGMKFES